jgi:hypothetical protein
MEPWLHIEVSGDCRGHFRAACRATDQVGVGNTLTFTIDFDQTELPEILNDLDAVCDAFRCSERRERISGVVARGHGRRCTLLEELLAGDDDHLLAVSSRTQAASSTTRSSSARPSSPAPRRSFWCIMFRAT